MPENDSIVEVWRTIATPILEATYRPCDNSLLVPIEEYIRRAIKWRTIHHPQTRIVEKTLAKRVLILAF